ncbi:MAG: hypothetical protein PUI86_07625 [Bacteroidales bacterium]|nr:hypothetical protein [Bacteroidales bacterium]
MKRTLFYSVLLIFMIMATGRAQAQTYSPGTRIDMSTVEAGTSVFIYTMYKDGDTNYSRFIVNSDNNATTKEGTPATFSTIDINDVWVVSAASNVTVNGVSARQIVLRRKGRTESDYNIIGIGGVTNNNDIGNPQKLNVAHWSKNVMATGTVKSTADVCDDQGNAVAQSAITSSDRIYMVTSVSGNSLSTPNGTYTSSTTAYPVVFYSVKMSGFESPAPTAGEWDAATKWYKIKIKGNYWSIGSSYTDDTGYMKANNTTAPTDPNGLWCIVGNAADGYKFYNMAMGTDYVFSTQGIDAEQAQAEMVEATSSLGTTFDIMRSGTDGYCAKVHGSDKNFLNVRDPWLSHWKSQNGLKDNGSKIIFEAVSADDAARLSNTYYETIKSRVAQWRTVPLLWPTTAVTAAHTTLQNATTTIASRNKAARAAGEAFVSAVNNARCVFTTKSTTGGRTNLVLTIGATQCKGKVADYSMDEVVTIKAYPELKMALYGEANNKYCNIGTAGTDPTNFYYLQTSSATTAAVDNVVCFRLSDTGVLHMQNSGSSYVLTNFTKPEGYDSFDDDASRWLVTQNITPYDRKVKKEALQVAVDNLNLYIGDGVGKYTYTPGGSDPAIDDVLSNATALLADPTADLAALDNALTAATTVMNTADINQPATDKLYRIKSNQNTYISNQIVRAGNSNYYLKTVAETDLPGTIFYLTADNKLLSYAEGLYLGTFNGGQSSENNEWTFKGYTSAGTAVTFVEGSVRGTYKLRPGNAREICANSRNVSTGGTAYMVDAASTGQTAAMYNWTLEEVTSLPVPISRTYKMGTFYTPVPIKITDTDYSMDTRLKFYLGKLDNDGYLTLSKVRDNIPAHTPFVIEMTGDAAYANDCQYMTVAESAPAIEASTYSLVGTMTTIATPTDAGTIYTLQRAYDASADDNNSATQVAFRQYTGSTIKGFRAYLPVASNLSVRGMRFIDDETTRIESITAPQHQVEAYDLSGRRVNHAGKGIYIVNGRKVIVK